MDERWFYYTLDSGLVYNVRTGVLEMCKSDGNGNVGMGCALSFSHFSCGACTESAVTIDKAKALMTTKVDEQNGDVPPSSKTIKDILAVNKDSETF